jgi:hypothetical protein
MQSAFGYFVDLNHRRTAAGSTDRLRHAGGQDKPTTPERLTTREIRDTGKRLLVSGVHVSSERVTPNEVGVSNLRRIARAVLEISGYDEILAEGAVRTIGAHRGRRPRSIRFTRDRLFATRRKTGRWDFG